MLPPREPLYPAEDLYGIVQADVRKPYDVREVIARLVDGSEFDEFKKLYGQTLVCGTARIWGYPVGILANNGILFSESALKGAHFIELMSQRGIPLFSCRTSRASWSARNTRRAASPRTAPSSSPPSPPRIVPKYTVVIGGSYGAGNYGMCGRGYSPRFLWMWPNAKIAVMGGEQAATVLAIVRREAHRGQGRHLEQRGGGGVQGARPRAVRRAGGPLLRHRAAVGRRHHRSRRHAHGAGAGHFRRAERAAGAASAFGVFRM